jgi:hypothetical protein
VSAALQRQENSWYSVLLEAKSKMEYSAAGSISSAENSNDLILNRTDDFRACSIVEVEVEVEVNLRPRVSRPVRLGIGPPFGTLDQILACSSFFC